LEQGNLVERGTHTDLLAKKGVYYRLFSAQSSFITA
jgi:ABC-type multidrug transport system fused ATPase/permease subunit